MAELSSHELSLLNIYMYFPLAATTGLTIEETINKYFRDSNGNWNLAAMRNNAGAGMDNPDDYSDAELIAIFEELLNSPLAKYRAVKKVDDGILGVCFVDDVSGDVVVAFRGTGGKYAAWRDNFEALANDEYASYETEMQARAAEFINSLKYNNITVTGHSKGGNLSMYVTVVCEDKIDKCYSFDGQGFNDEFCERYADEIARVKNRIYSISAQNDYVNVLLNSIAGTNLYVITSDDRNPHSPYDLYFMNKDEYNLCKQGFWVSVLHDLTLLIDNLPDQYGEIISDVIGIVVAGLLADDAELIDIALDLAYSYLVFKIENFDILCKNIALILEDNYGITDFKSFVAYISEDPLCRILDIIGTVLTTPGMASLLLDVIITNIFAMLVEETVKQIIAYAIAVLALYGIAAGTVIAVIAAVAVAIVVVYALVKIISYYWDEIKAAISYAIEELKKAISAFFDKLMETLVNMVSDIVSNICDRAEQLVTFYSDAVDYVADKASDIVYAVKRMSLEYLQRDPSLIGAVLYSIASSVYGYVQEPLWLNTAKLKSCVERMESVARRVADIDTRLDTLYRKLGSSAMDENADIITTILNYYNLASADINVNEGQQLRRKANAIRKLYEDYEAMEAKVMSLVPKKI